MLESQLKRNMDLFLAMFFATISIVAFSILPLGDIVRALLILPLILFLPGYAIGCLLFPLSADRSVEATGRTDAPSRGRPLSGRKPGKKGIETEEVPEKGPFRLEPYLRLGLSFVLSIVISSLLQFIFNELYPLNEDLFGLRPVPTITSLYLLVMISSIGSLFVRARKNVQTTEPGPKEGPTIESADVRGRVLTVILALVLITSVTFTFIKLYNWEDSREIELYVLGKGGEIQDYPDLLMVDGIYSLVIGVHDTAKGEGGMTVIITTSSEVASDAPDVSDPQVFNRSTSVMRPVIFGDGDTMEYRLNFSFGDPGKYTMSFHLIQGGEVIRKTWMNLKVFLVGNIWTNVNNKVRIYLEDINGEPFTTGQTISSRTPLFLSLDVINDEIDIFRMNTTIYLEGQQTERWAEIHFNDIQNLSLDMSPGTVFVNQTILRAHSKFIGVFRILVPEGSWTLRIGVNEQGLGCLLKLDVLSI